MLERDYWRPGQKITVAGGDGQLRRGVVVPLPFREIAFATAAEAAI
jgi:hypothetical protein